MTDNLLRYITSVLPVLTHVRDRAFDFCRILVGFPRSSEKPPLIAQIFKPSSALATTEPYSLDYPRSLQLSSKQISVVQPKWWAWLTSYDILDDPSFLMLIIGCNSIEAAYPVEIS